MSFFNLFFKNLLGCKIKESDIICNKFIKKNNSDYLNVSLSLSDSKEKYAVNKVIDKLKLDDRQYTFNNYESFNDQLQKISDELDRLKLSDTVNGGGKRKFEDIGKNIDESVDNTLHKKHSRLESGENKVKNEDENENEDIVIERYDSIDFKDIYDKVKSNYYSEGYKSTDILYKRLPNE